METSLSVVFVTLFTPVLPFGLGLAAGAMFWMVGFELLPDARKTEPVPRIMAVFLVTSLLFVAALSLL